MESLLQDLRYAGRTLRKSPGFTAVAVLTLALGIGGTTGIFSVVDAVLLRPLGYADADRLFAVWMRYLPESGYDYPHMALSWPEFRDYRQETRSLADIAAFQFGTANVTEGAGEPERVRTVEAMANLFSVLGVQPVAGRAFLPGEDRPGAGCTVVLGHALWVQRFGRDPALVGRTLNLDGAPCEVVGVMPAGFAFPIPDIGLYRSLSVAPDNPLLEDRSSHGVLAVGRLAPGTTLPQAEAELEAIRGRWEVAYPEHHGQGHFVVLQSLKDWLVGGTRPMLLALFGGVALVLLLICANLAGLLLARAEGRRREVAVRMALGAARGRLIRQVLTESVVLALLGGALGLLVAVWSVQAMIGLVGEQMPRADEVGINARALFFNFFVSLAAGTGFGLAPALQLSAGRLYETLRHDAWSLLGSVRGTAMRRALIVGQIALALSLVAGAALLVQSYAALQQVRLGFDPRGLVTAQVVLPWGAYSEPARVVTFYRDVQERLASLPGVEAAGAISNLPLASWPGADDFVIEGRPEPGPGEPNFNAGYYMVTPGALEALRVPLLRGRSITGADEAGAPLVALINEAAARQFWPGEDPMGQRIHYYGSDSLRSITVVGIVGDTRYRRIDKEPQPAVYVPHAQLPRAFYTGHEMTLLARGAGGAVLGAAIRSVVRQLDPSLPISNLRTMEEVVADATGEPRFLSLLMSTFALMALLLGGLGIYGLIAYTVRQRTSELGIRLALGASPAELFRLVTAQGMRLAVLGVTLGLVGALLAGRALASLLYGVRAADPLILGAVALTLLIVAFAASAIPSRRAARVDPLVALRAE